MGSLFLYKHLLPAKKKKCVKIPEKFHRKSNSNEDLNCDREIGLDVYPFYRQLENWHEYMEQLFTDIEVIGSTIIPERKKQTR